MVDFQLSDEQRALQRATESFAATLNEGLEGRDSAHEFSVDGWRRCARFGMQGLVVPEKYGGQGADPLAAAVALEALGYGCRDNGLIFSLNAQMWSASAPILRFGTDEQKGRYLPGMCSGEIIGVQGMTEPGAGSDSFSMSTRATASDDGWVLTGNKTFITNAPVADIFVIFATEDPGRGWAGLTAFLVPRDTPGLTIGSPFHKLGLHTSPMSELAFDDCRLPRSAVLGASGLGMTIFNHSMDWERSFILASAVGTMRRQLETTIRHAKAREQFGQPIGKFQAVSHRIVDMKMRHHTAQLLLYHMAWRKTRGERTPMETALVKLYVSESWVASSLDQVQIHGGYGYLTESGLERDLRDAIGSRIYSGTSEIQRNLVARTLGL